MSKKNYIINIPYQYKVVIIKNNKYLLIQEKNCFFNISSFSAIICQEKKLTFSLTKSGGHSFFRTFKELTQFLEKIKVHYTRRLKFKGLGLKYNYKEKENLLELKLGYSHILKIKINALKMSLKLLKNTIIFSSLDNVYLGNFVYKIKKLKMPNQYKGKGLLYKREKIQLKPIKKK